MSNPYANNYELKPVAPAAGGNEDMIAFFQELDTIKRGLVQYQDNVDRIDGLHRRSLTEFNDEASQQWMQQQLDQATAENQSLSGELKASIQTLLNRAARDPTKRAQAENAKTQFITLIRDFQAAEASFRQQYREAAEHQFRIVRPDATDAEVREAVEDANAPVFQQALLSSNRRGQARTALAEVQTRHREIEKIEKTMAELAQLFKDMELLVAEQEAPVQHIDEQAQVVQHDIEQGVAHTSRAVVSARSARKYKWWCVLVVFIIVAVLAIALGVHFGNK